MYLKLKELFLVKNLKNLVVRKKKGKHNLP